MRLLPALLISTASFGADLPVIPRQLDGVFLEPMMGYENLHITSGEFTDCSSVDSPSFGVELQRCNVIGGNITLRGTSSEFQIEFKTSLTQTSTFQGKRLHSLSLTGHSFGHGKIPDGETVVVNFWYPADDATKLRGSVFFKDLSFSKPFVLKN